MQTIDWDAFEPIGQHTEMQPMLNFQFLTALKAFFTLLTTDDLDTVDELSLTLVHSSAFQLAAQEIKADSDMAVLNSGTLSTPCPCSRSPLAISAEFAGLSVCV